MLNTGILDGTTGKLTLSGTFKNTNSGVIQPLADIEKVQQRKDFIQSIIERSRLKITWG